MAINRTSPKKGKVVDIPTAPTIGTATAGSESATVAYTAATKGGPATTFTALSNPGSITGTGTSSPITVSGLTAGTAYTFTVRGSNATGSGEYSSASNSITALASPYAYESIATYTLSSDAGITFSSIPQTYKHLQLRITGKSNRASFKNDTLAFQFNSDTGNNYACHEIIGDGSTTEANKTTSYSMIYYGGVIGTGVMNSNNYGASVVDIFDYSDTSKYTTTQSIGGWDDNGSGVVGFLSGLWSNTAAVTSIYLRGGEGTNLLNGTTVALYGIKG